MSIQHDRALAPVSSTTRRDVVVAAIRHALLSGELTPGQRVKEASLAEALGVSRPTIREAFHQLIHEGLLLQEPYKGIRVARPSKQDLLDVAAVRVSLETLAACQVASQADGAGMALLHAAHQAHQEAVNEADPVKADLTHLALHRALWEAADNQMLMRIWPLVESQIRVAMSLDQATWSDLARDGELHVGLINAIAGGDEEQISTEIREHIAASAEHVVTLIERQEPSS